MKQSEKTNVPIDINRFSTSLLTTLVAHRIIYDDSHKELDYIKFKHFKDKYNSSYLSLVIMPTLKCNLSCHYCYEKDKSISITNENINVLKLVFQKQSVEKKSIIKRWSGGEFLTKWKEVRELSKYIKQQCELNDCVFLASAITNGTLITPEIVEEMEDCQIKSIQITLDGARNIHDKIRFTQNGLGTFDRIIKSIEIASQKLKIIVRINVDKNNYSSMDSLFASLARSNINKSNIQLFCKPVLCSLARTPRTDLFSHKEFYSIELQLLKLAEKV